MWICEDNDCRFTVTPEGTKERRKELYKNGKQYIGKMLTVKYQELTKYGVPRFGTGVAIRDYE